MMGNKVHDIGVTGVMMSALVLMMVSKGVRAQNCGCEAANTGIVGVVMTTVAKDAKRVLAMALPHPTTMFPWPTSSLPSSSTP